MEYLTGDCEDPMWEDMKIAHPRVKHHKEKTCVSVIHTLSVKSNRHTSQTGLNTLNNNFSSVAQSCLTATLWTEARQAPLSITYSRSLLKLMFIVSVMPSNHLILCRPFLLLLSIFPSIRVFSNESVLHSRWPKYWSFCSFN